MGGGPERGQGSAGQALSLPVRIGKEANAEMVDAAR
jgi:hypothetical protein